MSLLLQGPGTDFAGLQQPPLPAGGTQVEQLAGLRHEDAVVEEVEEAELVAAVGVVPEDAADGADGPVAERGEGRPPTRHQMNVMVR